MNANRANGRSIATALVALAFLLAACSSSPAAKGAASTHAAPTTTLPAPTVTATITDGATNVPLDAPIGLTVTNGKFTTVDVAPTATASKAPDPGDGAFDAAHTGWLSPSDFAPATGYRISATVAGANGRTTNHAWSFTTGAPKTELHTTTNVEQGSTYGVGMPIIVKTNVPIPAILHKALTDRLEVTSEPPTVGGWHWVSDSELHYRPQAYWPAHTQVHLGIQLAGLSVGGGVWGVDGRTVNFAIGDSHVSVVDAAAHTMTVSVNGQQVNQFPISTGRPGPTTETRSGIHVVNEKDAMVVMDSSTIGIPVNSPGGYRIDAQWAVRISNSGEYVHSAPWSVDAQGHANVSHGCVNAAPNNAEWFYNLSMTGDVVQVINTGRQLEPWNGYGDWQIPWAQWVN
ncbi:MAG: L,D-transpeptidase family protein [Actinobacteria bacterium]|nr:L,D-transpeptidase family protein [Actinomycetota bacterium]